MCEGIVYSSSEVLTGVVHVARESQFETKRFEVVLDTDFEDTSTEAFCEDGSSGLLVFICV